MDAFKFVNLENCPEVDSIELSDLYHQAKVIDSPKKIFKNMDPQEQEAILAFYRSGRVFKILYLEELIGYIGYGTQVFETITIFYIFLPKFRAKGLFAPMIKNFSMLCRKKYPEKKFLRANTEASNLASINALEKAGFRFIEEKIDGPENRDKVVFKCFVRPLL